ncbi:MAG: ABC transporter ATP-binding protein [Clostridia bacterium]|nr:ABC transporter ATP-binding protein [Clostridia bacterium]MBR2327763.1 ABC transporter ATP-binding protein [Clostridia bacterium]
MKKILTFFKNNFFILGIIWKDNKSAIFGKLSLSFLSAVKFFFEVYTIKWIFDALESGKTFDAVLPLLILASVCIIFPIFYRGYYQLLLGHLHINKTFKSLNLLLVEKSKQLDLECYENAEFFDNYTRALADLEGQVLNTFNMLGWFFDAFFNLIIMLSLFGAMNSGLLIIMVLTFVLQCGYSFIENKLDYKRNLAVTYPERQINYSKRIIYEPKYAKEIKLFKGLPEILKNLYSKGVAALIKENMQFAKKITLISMCYHLLNLLLQYGLPFMIIGYQYFYLGTSLGTAAVLVNAVAKIPSVLSWLIWTFSAFQRNSLYVDNLNKVLNCEPKVETAEGEKYEPKGAASIEMKNVTFTYRGEKEPTLKNINLSIKKGERVAFVGHNGAGKTSLVKLITRLYHPDSGEILINGKDVKAYDSDSYRKALGLVFQDFNLYAVNIMENVLMREIDNKEADEKTVYEALKKAGIYDKIAALPNGIYTDVTKEFNSEGVLFSGGEIQKIALARVFAKESDIIILDEPSSALDPIAEHEMFKNMTDAEEGKTSILISHRLCSVIHCDRIFYLEHGEIVEEGTHEELMAKNARYAHMFNVQAEKYKITSQFV